jgi:3-oxoacyl-[acyl-carrier protein] reductase
MTKRRLCILGGCGGIGRSLVAGALVRGYDVAVMDLKAALARHPPPPSTQAIEIDASDEASVARAFSAVASRWSALDGFVNAAGFLIEKHALADTTAHEFDVTITGNVRSTFLACKAALALLD